MITKLELVIVIVMLYSNIITNYSPGYRAESEK